MKAGAADQQSISHRLSNFLLTYRCTPHATTQEVPCRLFMWRSLRTRLDLLRPSCADRVQSRQSQQKTPHDQHSRPRELELGQSVMTRNFRSVSDWVPGVILRKSGPLSYILGEGWGWAGLEATRRPSTQVQSIVTNRQSRARGPARFPLHNQCRYNRTRRGYTRQS